MKDVLRGEWGFDGIVVSDWASVAEMMAHGFAADSKEAAMKAVNAGVDMEMVSYTFVKELPELIKEGKVKKSAIDDAVRNILRIKFRLGLFDNPYVDEKRIEELYCSFSSGGCQASCCGIGHLVEERKGDIAFAIFGKDGCCGRSDGKCTL